MIRILVAVAALVAVQPAMAQERSRAELDALIARHAAANGVPEALVRRVIVRESRYNAAAVGRGGTMGLMQIKHATARGVGYTGGAAGLLDADTNLTYAVRYLAGAYRAAGGNHDRAVAYYAGGYYHHAKRQGLTGKSYATASAPVQTAAAGDPAALQLPAAVQAPAPAAVQAPAAAQASLSPQTAAPARVRTRAAARSRVKTPAAAPAEAPQSSAEASAVEVIEAPAEPVAPPSNRDFTH